MNMNKETKEPKNDPKLRNRKLPRRPNLKDQLEQRLDLLPKMLDLRGFLSASVRPDIRDSEIIVCFADIRGFTAYCKRLQEDSHDRKIQNFLQRYFGIFVEGMVSWRTQWDREETAGSVRNNDLYVVKNYLCPTMFKNLGDGMMIVWEIPPGLPEHVDGQIAREVIDAVGWIMARFYHCFRNLSDVEKDSYSELVSQLDIGAAVARGHAWRLDFAHGVDYAGSVVNLTSRLLDYARPRGLIVQYLTSQALCDDRIKEGHGKLAKITGLKGFPGGAQVWLDPQIDSKQSGIALLSEKASRNASIASRHAKKRNATPNEITPADGGVTSQSFRPRSARRR
jgi:class 3 adenylate cyclase